MNKTIKELMIKKEAERGEYLEKSFNELIDIVRDKEEEAKKLEEINEKLNMKVEDGVKKNEKLKQKNISLNNDLQELKKELKNSDDEKELLRDEFKSEVLEIKKSVSEMKALFIEQRDQFQAQFKEVMNINKIMNDRFKSLKTDITTGLNDLMIQEVVVHKGGITSENEECHYAHEIIKESKNENDDPDLSSMLDDIIAAVGE